MKIAIATNNPNKLREIRAILGGFFDEALSLSDLGIDIDIEETGTTLTENRHRHRGDGDDAHRERAHQGAHHPRPDRAPRPRR